MIAETIVSNIANNVSSIDFILIISIRAMSANGLLLWMSLNNDVQRMFPLPEHCQVCTPWGLLQQNIHRTGKANSIPKFTSNSSTPIPLLLQISKADRQICKEESNVAYSFVHQVKDFEGDSLDIILIKHKFCNAYTFFS